MERWQPLLITLLVTGLVLNIPPWTSVLGSGRSMAEALTWQPKKPVSEEYFSEDSKVHVFKYIVENLPKDAVIVSDVDTTLTLVALTGRQGAVWKNSFHGWAKHSAVERMRDFDQLVQATDGRAILPTLDKYGAEFLLLRQEYELAEKIVREKLPVPLTIEAQDAEFVLFKRRAN